MFVLFKQKTAYEVRISDWSSDVCSSDLAIGSTVGPRSTMFIPSTNVFMPEELRMLLGGTAFSLGKDMDLQIENLNSVKADVFRTSIGITGELGAGWVLDAYYQYGQNKREQTASRARVNTPMIYAFDAVVDPEIGKAA